MFFINLYFVHDTKHFHWNQSYNRKLVFIGIQWLDNKHVSIDCIDPNYFSNLHSNISEMSQQHNVHKCLSTNTHTHTHTHTVHKSTPYRIKLRHMD